MSEQLDRIESLLSSLAERVGQNTEAISGLLQEVKQDISGLRQEVKQDISELKSDIACLDQRVDGLDTRLDGIDCQLNGEVTQITRLLLNLGDQMQIYEQKFEDLKLQVSKLTAEVIHMKGLFEAHMRRTDRILDYLVRHIGPDSAA